MFFFFRARAEKGIDASSVVWTLIYNGKLANQIASLAAIVVIKLLRTRSARSSCASRILVGRSDFRSSMQAHANNHAFRSNVSLEERKHVLYIGYEITRRVQAKLPKLYEANSILVLLLNKMYNRTNVISAGRISVFFKQNFLLYFLFSQAFFWSCKEQKETIPLTTTQ